MKAALLLLVLANVPHDFPPPIAHRYTAVSSCTPLPAGYFAAYTGVEGDTVPHTPTLTDNGDGTFRLQATATSGSGFSTAYKTAACPSGTSFAVAFIRSHDQASSGTTDLCNEGNNSDGTNTVCAACSFTGAWSRCTAKVTGATSAGWFEFGNFSLNNGHVSRAAVDVDVRGYCASTAVPPTCQG